MKSHRQIQGIAILATEVAILLSQLPHAVAQDPYIRERAKLQTMATSASARKLGLERYALVSRLEKKFGRVYSTPETSCTALFPAGRSDRVYLLQWNAYWPSPAPHNWLLCYQREKGVDALVYKVILPLVSASGSKSHTSQRLTNLQDVIGQNAIMGKAWTRRLGNSVRKDLATERDYIQYKYVLPLEALEVTCLSRINAGEPPGESQEEVYDINTDPLSHAKLKPGEFYKKYGFPVSSAELSHP